MSCAVTVRCALTPHSPCVLQCKRRRLSPCRCIFEAMATLAEHEGAMNGLFHQSCARHLGPSGLALSTCSRARNCEETTFFQVQPDGKYSIRLFDPQVKEWKASKQSLGGAWPTYSPCAELISGQLWDD